MKEPVRSYKPHPYRPRRKFDPNFKKEAVELWLASGKSGPTVAAELGVRASQLYAWAKAISRSTTHPSKVSTADLEKQLAALQRENDHLRQQRDILKKTLGILSQPPAHATNGSTP